MKTTAALVAGMLALWAGPTMAHEPPSGLLVHLPLDDDLEDAGGFAVPVDLMAPDGELLDSGVEFRDGRFGRALYVSGESALRVSLDLHPEFNPQVTISLWAYLESHGPGSGYVASNGTNDGHVLRLGSNGRPGIGFNGAQKSSDQSFGIGRWIFMAGTWDYQAGRAELYTGRRSATWEFEPQAGIDPQPDLWLGAWKTPSPHIAKGIRIDEVRVYDRVLTAEEIEGLWLGQPVPDSAAGRAAGGGAQTPAPSGTSPGVATPGSGSASNPSPSPAPAPESADEGATTQPPPSRTSGRSPITPDIGNPADRLGRSSGPGEETPGTQRPPIEVHDQPDEDAMREEALRRRSIPGDTRQTQPSPARQTPGSEGTAEGTTDEQRPILTRPGAQAEVWEFETPQDESAEEDGRRVIGWTLSQSEFHETERSGQRGDLAHPMELTDGGPLRSIRWLVRQGRPCRLILAGSGGSGEIQAGTCRPGPGVNRERSVSLSSAFVTGVGVVPKDVGPGISEVRLEGYRIDDEGERTHRETNTSGEVPSIATIDPPSFFESCGDDHLASGVIAHFLRNARGHTRIVGMQLICRRVVQLYE